MKTFRAAVMVDHWQAAEKERSVRPQPSSKLRRGLRVGLAGLFITAGCLHFLRGENFARIVPPYLPAPLALVYISGFFEILGGAAMLFPPTRRLAGYGLMALLVAVLPANVHMALNDIPVAGIGVPPWVLWLRLPFQGVLLAAVYWSTSDT
jgi:uncharacterized membrane protein